MEFKIGDRIQVKENGKTGKVISRYRFPKNNSRLYQILFDGEDLPEVTLFCEDEIIPEPIEKATYHFEFDIAENLVAVRFYEDKGEETTLIGRGHGHVFHDGAVGIAQAGSYALKRLLEKINDGHYDLRETVLKEEKR